MLGAIAVQASLPWLLAIETNSEAAPTTVAVLIAVAASLAAMSFVVPKILRAQVSADVAHRANIDHVATMISFVLSESIAGVGLAGYMLGAGTITLWALCAAALVLMLLHFPRGATSATVDSRDLARADVKIGV